ncbi:hypothetical protein DM02DRAFT_657164, partial [Periconia macrospinosa]
IALLAPTQQSHPSVYRRATYDTSASPQAATPLKVQYDPGYEVVIKYVSESSGKLSFFEQSDRQLLNLAPLCAFQDAMGAMREPWFCAVPIHDPHNMGMVGPLASLSAGSVGLKPMKLNPPPDSASRFTE